MINAVFCFDEKYLYPAIVSTLSAIKNTKNLKIYWIVFNSFKEKVKHILSKYGLANSVDLISADDKLFRDWKEEFLVESYNFKFVVSRAAYLKFLIPELINKDKIIYLDSDTYVLSDLSELYREDLDNFCIGGVEDLVASKSNKIMKGSTDKYINSGVLLMNLKKIREKKSLSNLNNFYVENEEKIVWADQCIFNKIFEKEKKIINFKYNKIINTTKTKYEDFNQIIKKNHILHFAGGVKPWQQWCNPEIFNYYRKQLDKLNIVDFPFQKIDNVGKALMLTEALEINSQFQQSCKIKTEIIDNLLKEIDKS